MSWLFSQALVAEYLGESCSGGEPSAPSSANPMPQAYLPSDRMTAFSRPSRFGMTFAPLTDDLGVELLTWFLEASRARTFRQPERAQESTANAPACGGKWHELSVRYDRDSCSWRTNRSLWDEDLSACSLTLPKWGSMRDGVLSELLMLERHTAANDAGLWPTPNVPNGGRSCAHVTDWRGKTAYHNGKKVQVGLEHAARYWPTPKANDAEKRGNFDTTNPRNGLPVAVKSWPTPTASLGTKGGRVTPHKSREGGTLIEAVSARKTWPTPTAVTDTGGAALCKWGGSRSREKLRKMVTPQELNGALNPTWVEWLMNWPLGWTSLEPMKHENWKHWKESSAAHFQSNVLREMWFDRDPATPPQGSQPVEQRAGECGSPVPTMPQGGSHDRWNMGKRESGVSDLQSVRQGISAEADATVVNMQRCVPVGMGADQCREAMEYVPRVATGVMARVDRLKAIGNGQVPRVAATAWRILTHNWNYGR